MKKYLVFSFALFSILSLTACSTGVSQEDYDEIQQNYQTLVVEIDGIISERDKISENYSNLQNEHNDLQQNYKTLTTDRDKISNEYNDFKEQMSVYADLSEEEARNRLEEEQKREAITGLDSEISEKQTQLDNLKNLIVKTGEEPIRLPSGYFYGGTDVPAGRYQVSNGTSNFFVRRGDMPFVNIILGGRHGVDNYVFQLTTGDEIQSNAPVTLTPIE